MHAVAIQKAVERRLTPTLQKPWDIRVWLEWDANCNRRAVVEIANLAGHRDDHLKEVYLKTASARRTQDVLRNAYKEITDSGTGGSCSDVFVGWPNGGQDFNF